MNPTVRAARVAGAWYLLLAATSLISFTFVPTLIVPGNATATANNILASETLFRVSIVLELAAAVVFVLLVLALYRLLVGVNKGYATLMVAFVLVSVPIAFLGVLNELAALVLVHGADSLSAFSQGQLNALALVFLDLHTQVAVINTIFFGLWLFPFGVLVYRSAFIPRIFGILLIVSGFAYLAQSLVSLVSPGVAGVVGLVLLLPEGLGELSTVAWLLIKGARTQPTAPTPALSR